jgi:hypothetical protein
VAKEDFCFTYYDGDAARDKAHMNRLQRGAYDDIISAQRKRGHLSIDDIKRVLSKDFDECWPALEWVLKKDDAQNFFIEWVDKSIEKMRKHSEKQKEKVNARWGKNKPDTYPKDTTVLPQNNHGTDSVIPLENEDGNGYKEGNGFVEGGMGETIPVGIVPEMLQVFMIDNPDYPSDKLTDFPALRLIAGKILKWQKLKGDITLPENSDQIKFRWGELVPFIRADQHFSGYSILQISKYFQSIVQSFNNVPTVKYRQTHTGGNSGDKPGTSEARIRRAKEW